MAYKTITRSELVRVADETLSILDLTSAEIDETIRAQVMAVAHEAPKVAADASWWVHDEEYGCFTGWILRGPPQEGTDLEAVGYAYLSAMAAVLGKGRWDDSTRCLEVVPDAA